jgi:hypothetical protein
VINPLHNSLDGFFHVYQELYPDMPLKMTAVTAIKSDGNRVFACMADTLDLGAFEFRLFASPHVIPLQYSDNSNSPIFGSPVFVDEQLCDTLYIMQSIRHSYPDLWLVGYNLTTDSTWEMQGKFGSIDYMSGGQHYIAVYVFKLIRTECILN